MYHFCCLLVKSFYFSSYDEALQALADSEAKRETAERELKVVREILTI